MPYKATRKPAPHSECPRHNELPYVTCYRCNYNRRSLQTSYLAGNPCIDLRTPAYDQLPPVVISDLSVPSQELILSDCNEPKETIDLCQMVREGTRATEFGLAIRPL